MYQTTEFQAGESVQKDQLFNRAPARSKHQGGLGDGSLGNGSYSGPELHWGGKLPPPRPDFQPYQQEIRLFRSCCGARGTLLSVMWQPGCKGSLGENGYMDMYGWVSWLFTRKDHNIANRLYSNTNFLINLFNWRLITLQYCSGFLPYIDMNQPSNIKFF